MTASNVREVLGIGAVILSIFLIVLMLAGSRLEGIRPGAASSALFYLGLALAQRTTLRVFRYKLDQPWHFSGSAMLIWLFLSLLNLADAMYSI